MNSRHDKLGVALIGAGRFGAKRARAIASDTRSRLIVVADVMLERARAIAAECGCEAESDWRQAVERNEVNTVVVSTPNQMLSEISLFAIRLGKHTLAEKPFGRTPEEARTLVEAARASGIRLKAGYNHRYHPAIRRAHDFFSQGAIGRLLFLRCIYGHGGRPGYEREWRAQAALSGGGELLDQGVHALDLLRWFAGEFESVTAMLSTAYWPMAPVEDNVFALLRSVEGAVAQLHASWTYWKNTFSFEALGEKGYLRVNGLGGTYGVETLCLGVREGLGDVPREQSFVFPSPDESLTREWEAFAGAILDGEGVHSDGLDALRTLQLAEAIYRAAREGQTVRPEVHSAVLSDLVT
jgi:predicted dehydrogenase